jgi:hypothetical protein
MVRRTPKGERKWTRQYYLEEGLPRRIVGKQLNDFYWANQERMDTRIEAAWRALVDKDRRDRPYRDPEKRGKEAYQTARHKVLLKRKARERHAERQKKARPPKIPW